MRGNQLESCLRLIFTRNSRVHYLGIFDLNKFDPYTHRTIHTSSFAVLNWRNEHWVSIFTGSDFIIFADSLGRDVSFYSQELSRKLQELCGDQRLLHFPFRIQPWHSRTCGYYLLYWAWLLSNGHSFSCLYKVFSPRRLSLNDHLITAWMRQQFPTYFIH